MVASMKRITLGRCLASLGVMAGLVAPSQEADAAPRLRRQWNLHGDFLIVGNTLVQECRTGAQAAPAPVVGTVGACGNNTGDSAPDVYWRSEEPGAGQALASAAITLAGARSTAVLGTGPRVGAELPAGASILHAQLYWAATVAAGIPRRTAILDRPGGFQVAVTAQDTYTVNGGGNVYYQCTADVTPTVRQYGPGVYRLSGIDAQPLVDQLIEDTFAGWTLVVVYERALDPVRNVALFDGLEFVQLGGQTQAVLRGFLVPTAGFDAKLGVIAYEGDDGGTGDSLQFQARSAAVPTTLSNAQNPASNFFNGTRSIFGNPVSLPGDLPQQTGQGRSMSGLDIDIVNITSALQAGDDQATITASSTSDKYAIGAFITSISTLAPDLATSSKAVRNLTLRPGGATFPGDVVEFTLVVTNTGSDEATRVVLTDVLPVGFRYQRDTVEILTGPNAGAKTDRKDIDQVDFDDLARTLTVRIGLGADGVAGGRLPVGQSSTLRFRAAVAAGTEGQFLVNQASISAEGARGASATSWPTDSGDGGLPEPTLLPVDGCATGADCPGTRCSSIHPFACEVCNGDFTSGATQPCVTSARPACNTTGALVGQCTECTGVNVSRCSAVHAPTCNTATGSCASCLVNYGAGASRACPAVLLPVCLVGGPNSGQCVACATFADCSGPTPVCTSLNQCAPCNGDNGSAVTRACPTSVLPYCQAAGSCGKCASNAECVGRAGPICNLTTGACGTLCSTDRDCRTTEWCAAGSCSPKTANDQPVPNVPPISGVCTPSGGQRACLSGVCSTADDRCGLPNDEPCGPAANDAICRSEVCFQADTRCGLPRGEPCTSAKVCRSGVCSTAGRCGECRTDPDCGGPTSGKVCDDRTSLCRDGCRARGGNGCAEGRMCTSTGDAIGSCVDAPRDAGVDAPPDAPPDAPAPPPGDAAAPEADAGLRPAPEPVEGGCSCEVGPGAASGPGFLALAALGLGCSGLRRRRRSG